MSESLRPLVRQARFPLMLCVASSLLVGIAVSFDARVASLAAGTAIAAGSMFLAVTATRAPSNIQRLAIGSAALHLTVGAVITFVPNFLYYFGIDAAYYHTGAAALARDWSNAVLATPLPSGKEGFIYLLAALYWIGEPSRASGLIANAGFAGALVPILWWITTSIFGPPEGRRAALLFLVLPGFVVWPAQLLREAGVLLLLSAVASAAIVASRALRLSSVALVAISCAALFTFRGPVALVVFVSTLVALAIGRSFRPSAIVGSALVLGLSFVLIVRLGVGSTGLRTASQIDLAQIDVVRRATADAASGFAADADVSTAKGALAYLPLGMVRFLLGPWPWQVVSVRQVPAVVDALAWWLLVPSIVRGIRRGWRRDRPATLVLLLPALFLTAGLSLGVANFGTVVRLRTQVLLLLIPFAAAGSKRKPGSQSDIGVDAPATVS